MCKKLSDSFKRRTHLDVSRLLVSWQEGTATDRRQAFKLLQQVVRRGHTQAVFAIGALLRESAELHHEAGSARATFILGKMYRSGVHVARNADMAFDLLTQACDLGSAEAAYTLAMMYGKGEDRLQDDSQAEVFLQVACAKGVFVEDDSLPMMCDAVTSPSFDLGSGVHLLDLP